MRVSSFGQSFNHAGHSRLRTVHVIPPSLVVICEQQKFVELFRIDLPRSGRVG
jgi:hypothetical protein